MQEVLCFYYLSVRPLVNTKCIMGINDVIAQEVL